MKSEPDVFSFDDLTRRPKQTESWDGVRNFQARNFMRDQFRCGDKVLFYHSSTEIPGVYGLAEVVREAYPDPTALNAKSPYYDEKSAQDGVSRWVMVDVQAKERLREPVTLAMIRNTPALKDMLVLKKGQRLSIQPVTRQEWETICRLGKPEAI